MFKKLLGFVLALTLALGACCAVFAEKADEYGWLPGEKDAAKAKTDALYNVFLDTSSEARRSITDAVPAYYQIALDLGEPDLGEPIDLKKLINYFKKIVGVLENAELSFRYLGQILSVPKYTKDEYDDKYNTIINKVEAELQEGLQLDKIKAKIESLESYKKQVKNPFDVDTVDTVIEFLNCPVKAANILSEYAPRK